MGSLQTRWEVQRGARVWSAWADTSSQAPIAMAGTDVLDAALVTGFKCEWLAAMAGAIPLVTIGGEQAIATIGGAGVNPTGRWSNPELRALYMMGQRSVAALHGSCIKAQRNAVDLPLGSYAPIPVQSSAGSSYSGKLQLGGVDEIGVVLPLAAWIVIGVVGAFAVAATAWYAVRATEVKVQVDADQARNTHAIGTLADIASQQLATKGAVDPNLLKTIGSLGDPKTPQDWSWAYALGAGGLGLAVGAGVSYSMRGRR